MSVIRLAGLGIFMEIWYTDTKTYRSEFNLLLPLIGHSLMES